MTEQKVIVKVDNNEHILTGRAALIVRWVAGHYKTINADRKGNLRFDYADTSLIPKRESVFDAIE